MSVQLICYNFITEQVNIKSEHFIQKQTKDVLYTAQETFYL